MVNQLQLQTSMSNLEAGDPLLETISCLGAQVKGTLGTGIRLAEVQQDIYQTEKAVLQQIAKAQSATCSSQHSTLLPRAQQFIHSLQVWTLLALLSDSRPVAPASEPEALSGMPGTKQEVLPMLAAAEQQADSLTQELECTLGETVPSLRGVLQSLFLRQAQLLACTGGDGASFPELTPDTSPTKTGNTLPHLHYGPDTNNPYPGSQTPGVQTPGLDPSCEGADPEDELQFLRGLVEAQERELERLPELRGQLEDAQGRLRRQDEHLRKLTEQLEEAAQVRKELAQQGARLGEALAQLAGQKSEAEALRAELEEAEEGRLELALLQAHVSDLGEDNAAQHAQIQELQAENGEVRCG